MLPRSAAALLCLVLAAGRASAQELEPRAYSPSPVGTNFLVGGYGYTWGGVLADPSLPVSDVEAKIHTATLGYGRTFGLFGRRASAGVVVPYVWADVSGDVGADSRRVTRDGVGDPRLRFSLNLVGAPALTPAEFARRTEAMTLGTSLVVVLPLGKYDSKKLVNIGTNRWAFKPELGLSHPLGRWDLDLYGGAWVFRDNADFFGGRRREQAPLWTLQSHVSYTFRPRLWLAADATFYDGGRTTVDGERQSIKIAWSRGATTRIGGDFDVIGVATQAFWFD